MPKVSWSEMLSHGDAAHIVAAILPDEPKEEKVSNALASLQLLERLFRKMPVRGEYALTVSRRTGQRAILCAFRDAADAAEAAKVTDASAGVIQQGRARQHHFLLDGEAEQKISLIAGPPAKRRSPRKSSFEADRH